MSKWKESPDGKYIIRDYHCQKFDVIVKSTKYRSLLISRRHMVTLATILDQSWNEYKQFVTAHYYDGANKNELGVTMSSFGHSLCSLPWLPSTSNSLNRGPEVYIDSELNRHLLHSHVPYLAAKITDSDFLQFLGVNISFNDDNLLKFLKRWSKRKNFCTSLDHMRNVYLCLYRKSSEYGASSSIVDSFKNGELVFVPNARWEKRKTDVKGCFYSVSKVCWYDQTKVLDHKLDHEKELPSHLPRILSLYYHDPHDLIKIAFIRFGVQENLDLQSLVDLLEFNASHRPTPNVGDLESFRSIAEVVCSTVCSSSQNKAMYREEGHVVDQQLVDFFVRKVTNLRVFPSQSKKWVTLRGLFWNDKSEIAKHFSQSDEVHFLQWPLKYCENLYSLLPSFVQLCNIPQLSNCYSLRVTPGSTVWQSDELREMLYHMIPLIQRYLFSHHSEEHKRLEHSLGIVAYLDKLQILSSLELKGLYVIEVDGKEKVSEPTAIKQCSLEDDALYVVTNTSGKISNKLSLVDVLIRMFFREIANTVTEIRPFLTDLVVNDPRSEEEISDIVAKYILKDLPQDSTRWNVNPPTLTLLPDEKIVEQNEPSELSSHEERDCVTQEDPTSQFCTKQLSTKEDATLHEIASEIKTSTSEVCSHSVRQCTARDVLVVSQVDHFQSTPFTTQGTHQTLKRRIDQPVSPDKRRRLESSVYAKFRYSS